jgi:hypothetical protein
MFNKNCKNFILCMIQNVRCLSTYRRSVELIFLWFSINDGPVLCCEGHPNKAWSFGRHNVTMPMADNSSTSNQCCGTESGLDPDPRGQKWPTKIEKSYKISLFEVLYVLFAVFIKKRSKRFLLHFFLKFLVFKTLNPHSDSLEMRRTNRK